MSYKLAKKQLLSDNCILTIPLRLKYFNNFLNTIVLGAWPHETQAESIVYAVEKLS